MKALFRFLGRLIGIHFAPDNHIIPVLRLGRYHRVKGPGFFWIIPLLERALPPVKTSIHVGSFHFAEVLSRDNIPFTVKMTVLFTFDPRTALKSAAAMLVRGGDDLFQTIMKDYADQGLRRLASRFDAEELCGETPMSAIERDLTHYLRVELRNLGLAPLRNGGIIIKEMNAPDKFKRTMLDARRDAIRTARLEAILQLLARYPIGDLIQQAIQAGFVTGLEDLEGRLTVLSSLSPLEGERPPSILDAYRIANQNGKKG